MNGTWDLYVLNQKENQWELHKSFEDANAGMKALEKKAKHCKCKLVFIPEIQVGLDIRKKGKWYGTIIDESSYFWYVARKKEVENELFDIDCFLKESFELHYVKGDFDTTVMEVGRIEL